MTTEIHDANMRLLICTHVHWHIFAMIIVSIIGAVVMAIVFASFTSFIIASTFSHRCSPTHCLHPCPNH